MKHEHHAAPAPDTTVKPGKAAFFDVDGTLISTNVVHAYGYYAMNEGSYSGIVKRTLQTVVNLPVFGALNLIDRKIFNEYFYRQYAGLTEDRLMTLNQNLFDDIIKPAIFPRAQDLIDQARRAGCTIVLVTGALDFTMRPLAKHLGADDLIANRMQFVGGKAPGKVSPPIIEGANKADVIPAMQDILRTRPSAHWLERLERIGVPGAPIHDLAQAAAQPQTQALGIFQDVPGADLRVVGLPVSFDGERPPVRSRAPALGQHNEAFGLPAAPTSPKETP